MYERIRCINDTMLRCELELERSSRALRPRASSVAAAKASHPDVRHNFIAPHPTTSSCKTRSTFNHCAYPSETAQPSQHLLRAYRNIPPSRGNSIPTSGAIEFKRSRQAVGCAPRRWSRRCYYWAEATVARQPRRCGGIDGGFFAGGAG